MIRMQAVLEVPSSGTARPWPIASVPPWSHLALTAGCTAGEAGLFVAALADSSETTAAGIVTALAAEESLIVGGGLRLTDENTGVTVAPGCCAGLENWRDWALALTGESPWLGHDPSTGTSR